jgi:hypothetical protein
MSVIYAEYRQCRVSFMLSVGINPSMLSVVKLGVVMMSVVMLGVVMMSVVLLIVVAPSEYTHNAITKSALLH